VATANIAVNEVISGECAEGTAEVRPCPPSLPAFGSGRVSNTAATAVLSSGSSGDTSRICNQQQGGICHQCPTPVGRKAKEILKILPITNGGPSLRHWIGKCNHLKAGGGGSESNMMMLMLLMQMQQMAQQLSIQQQMFQQQIQMQMSAMEKHADTHEKYLRRLAMSLTSHNNKRKRGRTDDKDNDSSNDDKYYVT
jgi:hypothetical protein